MYPLLHRAFVNPHSRTFYIVQDFLALLTIVSIVSLVLETVPALTAYQWLFVSVEWFAVGFFTLEYFGRLLVSQPRWRYPTSFFGIVDLLSIVPTFLGLTNLTFLKSARALRILRLLRMVRLAKIARSDVLSEERFGVLTFTVLLYFTALLIALLGTGTAMYVVESGLAPFASIPAGMWWSLKVFMAGIPVTEPVTALGEFFFVLTRFIGLLMLGLLIGVVGNLFRALVLGGRSNT